MYPHNTPKERERLADLYQYQIDEIDEAELIPAEEDELREKRDILNLSTFIVWSLIFPLYISVVFTVITNNPYGYFKFRELYAQKEILYSRKYLAQVANYLTLIGAQVC